VPAAKAFAGGGCPCALTGSRRISEERRECFMKQNEKQTWSTPKLTVFGDVEAITQANNKVFGTGDAFTFQGNPTRLSG